MTSSQRLSATVAGSTSAAKSDSNTVRRTPPRWMRIGALMIVEAAVVIGLMAWSLRLGRYDMTVPLNYWGDTLWSVSLVKGLLDQGWTFFLPELSAPFGLAAVAFPAMTTVDWALMKVIGWMVPHPGAVLNIYWLVSLVLAAWSASLALRLLGARSWLALIGGIVFALSPFAFLRNTGHISLSFFPIPLICSYAVHLANGARNSPSDRQLRYWGYIATVVQGFNYVYFSFFAVALYLIAGAIGYVTTRNASVLKFCAAGVVIAIAATAINLTPPAYIWSTEGKPPDMDFKTLADAEIFGLKLRRMLSPHAENAIPPLGAWGRLDNAAGFQTENENISARLGLLAAAGFLISIWTLIFGGAVKSPNAPPGHLQPISALVLAAFLIATVGGLGAIFNVLVSADIRAYNRFSVYLSFLSIAALYAWLETKRKSPKSSTTKAAVICAVVGLATLSVYDQLLDLAPVRHRQTSDQGQAIEERSAVRALEQAFPASVVFQLPITGFPPDGPRERMGAYDHARPYLWSRGTSWSWPSFSLRHRAWLNRIEALSGRALLEGLSLSGFSHIWIDRYGYKDLASELIDSLRAAGANSVVTLSPRYAVLDIGPVSEQLLASVGKSAYQSMSRSMLYPVTLSWGKGFYPEERPVGAKAFRWADRTAALTLRNPDTRARHVRLTFALQSQGAGSVTVDFGGKRLALLSGWTAMPAEIDIEISPGQSMEVKFLADTPKVSVPGELRSLYFTMLDFTFSDPLDEVRMPALRPVGKPR